MVVKSKGIPQNMALNQVKDLYYIAQIHVKLFATCVIFNAQFLCNRDGPSMEDWNVVVGVLRILSNSEFPPGRVWTIWYHFSMPSKSSI